MYEERTEDFHMHSKSSKHLNEVGVSSFCAHHFIFFLATRCSLRHDPFSPDMLKASHVFDVSIY